MTMNNIMLRLGHIDDASMYAKQLLDFAEQENMQWLTASALSELAIGAVTDISVEELMITHADLLKRADERLYKVKQNGRNQIVATD
ncbi:MAG: hypothetical protein HRT97_01545 [Moritella sp.]|uniref:hypothetical protein n=1 Tax=Moritella sp. TaxID=78556 RepID=UPI0025E0C64C|nr:hypothetical protein [Moritella sp.]NQZ91006.1 hypothetical protein [Moritella sp.]